MEFVSGEFNAAINRRCAMLVKRPEVIFFI